MVTHTKEKTMKTFWTNGIFENELQSTLLAEVDRAVEDFDKSKETIRSIFIVSRKFGVYDLFREAWANVGHFIREEGDADQWAAFLALSAVIESWIGG